MISVVDDDESVRDATRTLLRSVGYNVATFESSELFLESGTLPNTECLILDMRMPGIDGLELQRRLKASDASVPIIFVTAHSDRTNRQLAMDAGASDFFQKPFAASDLLGAIKTALQTRSVR
jgi:FixJ family two-component response regulator